MPSEREEKVVSVRTPQETETEVVHVGVRRLAIASAVLSLIVIAVGGATRATDSGLACPTWPGCFTGGDFLPPLQGEFVDALGRNVTGLNVWLEHGHRLLAGGLGLLIAWLGIWILVKYRHIPGLLYPAIAAGVMVIIQALLGAFVVWHLVKAELVTAHLALGTATMGVLFYLAARVSGPVIAPNNEVEPVWKLTLVTAVVTWVQTMIGGHLSGVVGGLAFKTDPLLGLFSVGPIHVEADAFNVVHRYLAFFVAGLIVYTAVRIRRANVDGVPRLFARLAVGFVLVQILLGIGNLYSDLSFLSVVPHLAVASWLIAALLIAAFWMRDGVVDGELVDETTMTETVGG